MNRDLREWQDLWGWTTFERDGHRPGQWSHLPIGSRQVGEYVETGRDGNRRPVTVHVTPDGMSQCRTPGVGCGIGVAFDAAGMSDAEIVAEAMRRAECGWWTCSMKEVA